MKPLICVLTCVLALGPTQLFAGSGNRTGTSSASELLIPIGPRGIAMGGSIVASTTGPEALFYNPAGVAGSKFDLSLFASHMNYIADIGVECASVAVDFSKFGVLALQLKALSVGDIPLTTVFTPDGSGQTFSPQYFTIGLTYARELTDRVRVGATVKLITERMAEVSASGFAFDMGVIYDHLAGLQGLSFGVSVKNIGPQLVFEGRGLNVTAVSPDLTRPEYIYKVEAASFELPFTIELGLAYRLAVAEEHGFVIAVAFQDNNFSDDAYRGGLEYGFRDLVYLRGGYEYAPSEAEERENIFGPTFGAGIHATVGNTDVTFDYAFRAVKFFNANHVFSVKIGL
jgi:opacity protein-like surface antigen